MPEVHAEPVQNRLLAGLPRTERRVLLDQCETVALEFGSVLCEADQPFRQIYFPLDSFISLVAEVSGHQPLEMGLIGSEGALGATLVLGVPEAPLRAIVQGPGSALRIAVAPFQKLRRDCPALTRNLSRYLYVLMAQLSQTAVCTRFHEVDTRLARWLLMTHDRAHADHFHLTHQFLAEMLGVRRSGITVAAGVLQQRGLIDYARGEIRILDRPGLELAACECYAAVVEDYRRQFA